MDGKVIHQGQDRSAIFVGEKVNIKKERTESQMVLESEELEQRIPHSGHPGNQGNGQLGYEGQPGIRAAINPNFCPKLTWNDCLGADT